MRLTILSIGLILIASALAAAPIELLVEEDGTTDAGTIGEFVIGDSDPNSLGVLSNGSIVYFESQFDAANGADDSIILFDEDAAGGGISRFTVIASEEALQTAAGLASTENFSANDIAVGDNDNVYLLAIHSDALPVDDWYIFRIPNLGGNSFGPPEVAANPTGIGSADGFDYSMAIDTSTSPDTLIIGIDDNNVANDATTNGIYTLDASVTNGTPTLIGGAATLSAVATAAGAIGGTDKGSCSSMTVIPGGNVIVSLGNSTTGGGVRGNIVEVNRTTGAASLWVDAALQLGTPDCGVVRYNSASGRVGVFWFIGTGSNTDPAAEQDRIDEYSTAGAFIKTVATEPDVEAVQGASPSTDLNIFSNAFATDGVNYYVFLGNNYEGLFRIPQTLPVELSVLSAD